MGGVCYKKNEERGLWFEIKCIEETMNETKDESLKRFCKKLLRSYKKYDEKCYGNGVDTRGKSMRSGLATLVKEKL